MLGRTMPPWPRDVEKRMVSLKHNKTALDQQNIDNDIRFLHSMMSDRIATYATADKVQANVIAKCEKRRQKQENQGLLRCRESNIVKQCLYAFIRGK